MKNCPHCGEAVLEGALFCIKCGGSLAQPAATPTPVVAAATGINAMTAEMKILLAIAAGVLILVGGFIVALFSGALDGALGNAFGRSQIAATAGNNETETTTAKEKVEEAAATTTEASTTETAAAAAATTTATAAKTTEAAASATTVGAGTGTDVGGVKGELRDYSRKTSPVMEALLRELNAHMYASKDASAHGVFEESVINMSTALFSSTRNISAGNAAFADSMFAIELDLDIDLPDDYIDELVSTIFGPSGGDPQITESLRVIGSSEFILGLQVGSEVKYITPLPVVAIYSDWLVKAKPFITSLCYIDMQEAMFVLPGISDKVFWSDKALTMTPMGNFANLLIRLAYLEVLGGYVEELLPYIEDMVIAFSSELIINDNGKEELTLPGGSVTLDTIDVYLDEVSTSRALIAALNVLNDSFKAKTLIFRAYNESIAYLSGDPQIDLRMIDEAISGAISSLSIYDDELYEPDNENTQVIRLYMNDGLLAGVSVANPHDANQFGCVTVPGYGYSFWYAGFFSKYGELAVREPVHQDPGFGDRFEIYGNLTSGAKGLSGDVGIFIREQDDEFDEKLVYFNDLNIAMAFGMPMITGKITADIMDICKAFYGKEYHKNWFVQSMAYVAEIMDDIPMLKDMEITIEMESAGNDYMMRIKTEDLKRRGSAALALKLFTTDKPIAKPSGTIVDLGTFNDLKSWIKLLFEVMDGIYAKIDELTAYGYNMEWLKGYADNAVEQ